MMPLLQQLPLVGRSPELAAVRAQMEACENGHGAVVFLSGDGGIGKTRLAAAMLREAEQSGFRVASGRAYAAESGVPYSLFADALLPVLDTMSDEARIVVTRGAEAELIQ